VVGERKNKFGIVLRITYIKEVIMDNYIDLTVEEIYEIICESDHYWPSYMSIDDKIEFLENMMSYFASQDDFEKCIRLQKIADEIRNPSPSN
jgi:hypothetical protein